MEGEARKLLCGWCACETLKRCHKIFVVYKMKRMFELQAVKPRIFGVDNDHVALLLLLTGCTHNIAPSISS
jgi:hypothetical protein